MKTMNGLASLQTKAMTLQQTPGLSTLSVPANRRPQVKRQLSLPVTSHLTNTPVIANKINPWPLEQETRDEETSLMADNR